VHRKKSKSKEIALIYVDGPIEDGAEKIRKAVRLASNDQEVAAIMLRVSSPGGSVVESEYIWRAPIVASFGNVSASGGYFISAPAAKIFADRSTNTGSIRVIAIQLNAKELLEKLGVKLDFVQSGNNAVHFTSVVHEWPSELEKKFNSIIDVTYHDFVSKVATGRNKDYVAVHQIAKGRVWSGAAGLKLGVVDEIGGLKQAVESAKALGGLYPFEEAKVVVYPKWNALMQLLDLDVLPYREEQLLDFTRMNSVSSDK